MLLLHVVCDFAVLYNIFLYCIINGTIFEKKKERKKKGLIEYKIFVLIFSATFETFFIPRRIGPDVIKNVYWS